MSVKIMSLVYQRSGGLCEALITSRCTGRGEHKHHRKLRSRGGVDSTSCLVDVCHHCHDWIHAHPKDSTERGWMVPSWAEPREIPVYRYRQWVLLDDEGGLSPAGVVA